MFREIKIGLAIAGTLAVLSSCGVANHYKKDRDNWRTASRKWEAAWEGQKAAYDLSEKNRKAEYRDAVADLADAQEACNYRVSQARDAERATTKLLSRPVKIDARGCPIETIWTRSDLSASLNGWGR